MSYGGALHAGIAYGGESLAPVNLSLSLSIAAVSSLSFLIGDIPAEVRLFIPFRTLRYVAPDSRLRAAVPSRSTRVVVLNEVP